MLLRFTVKNYRSYKEEVTFSMEAEASKQKGNNIFEYELGNNQIVKYLKSSAIYGANASGKTNMLRALSTLIRFILFKPKFEEMIELHDPYRFDDHKKYEPSCFDLIFIGPHGYKYLYSVKTMGDVVTEEELHYYPNSRKTELFSRSAHTDDSILDRGILGYSKDKREITVFKNQLILSKFGDDEPDELLSLVFAYFRSYIVINAVNSRQQSGLQLRVSRELYQNDVKRKKVAALIQGADTKISGLEVRKVDVEQDQVSLFDELNVPSSKEQYSVYFTHDTYDADKPNGSIYMRIEQESRGSQLMYTLSGNIVNAIDNGGILIVDELDTSLHPFITRLIVMLFQSESINKKGAQLIFTTHDVSLLDKDLLRRDQIWFAEKSDRGVTDFYSLQDFEGLREDTPFEKWYLAGKFGALPNIKSIEKIFEDVSAS